MVLVLGFSGPLGVLVFDLRSPGDMGRDAAHKTTICFAAIQNACKGVEPCTQV